MTDLGKSPLRRALALTCAALVSTAALAGVPALPAVAAPQDDEAALRADADGPLRISREGGEASFVGTPAGTEIDNPSVGRRTPVATAARAHLDRYGAAVGADRRGTRLVEESRRGGGAGGSVVRFRQQVDGVPVLGGDVVMTLDAGRDLASLDANLSETTSVGAATVSEASARAMALGVLGRQRSAAASAEPLGRWLLDPATVPVDGLTAPRTAWRFEVRDGSDVRRMVLVDDRAGSVLLDIDLIQPVDRVVCDQKNVAAEDPAACTGAYARTEGSGSSSVGDVNDAFENAGRVSELYAEHGTGVMQDLTDLIGQPTGSGKKLASTVRVCITDLPCPFSNAYWNGEAMFYGAGFAAPDDIVGHEMTHGVIERTSGLIYWDQSGAINESLADIVGEIVDHRNGVEDDQAFLLGENVGAARSMKHPPLFDQPDRVGSNDWYAGQEDNGGVHTNSGVGNKAFYLISQGGTFNGQTITGIDAGDARLAKSTRLWMQVIATVPTFAEYGDLASVLEQACATLQGAGDLTAADCEAVHAAVLATQMDRRPTAEPVRDVDRSCPDGTFRRVLLDSESGADPAAKFTAARGWWRSPHEAVVSNAYSGDTAWYAEDSETVDDSNAARPLRAASWITVPPAGQSTYLAFRHWHVFEHDVYEGQSFYWDGGTVEVARDGLPTASVAARPWVNGPTRVLDADSGGYTAFAGSSKGWYGSRVALDGFAGQRVKPQFTMRYDGSYGAPGWYLDDIEVYTCDPPLARTGGPGISGTLRVGNPLTATSKWNVPGVVRTHQWLRDGRVIAGATRSVYTPVAADLDKRLSVVVNARLGEQTIGPYTGRASSTVARGRIAAPAALRISGTPYVGRRIGVVLGTWSPGGLTFRYQWYRDGRAISGATRSTYLLTRADKGRRILVRATATKTAYNQTHSTSAAVLIRR